MKKLISFILLGVALNPVAYAFDYCQGTGDSFGAVEELAESALKITGSMEQTQKVLGVTITKFYKNQGSGKVSVVTDAKGNIAHKSQYLNFEKGTFPNYDFLRHLKKDLGGIEGTIIRGQERCRL